MIQHSTTTGIHRQDMSPSDCYLEPHLVCTINSQYVFAQSPLKPLVAPVLRSLRGRTFVKRYPKIDGAARLEKKRQLVTFGDIAALV